MARVFEASTTGPVRGGSAPSPLGREGGLSKLIRSSGIREALSVPLLSSSSKSAFLGPASGVSKSYVSQRGVRTSLEVRALLRAGAATELMGVIGNGDGTSATRGDSSAVLGGDASSSGCCPGLVTV